jgi:exodeoxyribonuclease III
MKLMTYNILNGGEDRLRFIIEVISREKPDFLVINEANGFDKNHNQKLNKFAGQIGLTCFNLSLSGEYDYHTAIFSKYPFIKIEQLRPMRNAGILVTVKTELGNLSIAGIHLNPYTEDSRLKEIDLITSRQKQYENKIMMGDFNSLSKTDDYNQEIINEFNDYQLEKFTIDGKFRFDVINKIISLGYLDTASILNKQKINTVPTKINQDSAHMANIRVDYVFVSEALKDKVKNYSVIKNALANKASDHFPITVELK